MDTYQYLIIGLLGIIVILLILILICCCIKSRKSNQNSEKPSNLLHAQEDSTSDEQINVLKELLGSELSNRASGSVARFNMLNQYRLLIPTLLIAGIGLLSTKNGISGDLSRYLVSILLIVIAFSGYWWDCYINDLQSRVNNRIKEIRDALILLPSLKPQKAGDIYDIELKKIKTEIQKDLTESNWCNKLCLLVNGRRFEHLLFWFPPFTLGSVWFLWLLFN